MGRLNRIGVVLLALIGVLLLATALPNLGLLGPVTGEAIGRLVGGCACLAGAGLLDEYRKRASPG